MLALELVQPLEVGHVRAAELRAPLAKGGLAKPALAAQLLDRHPRVGRPMRKPFSGVLFKGRVD